MGVPTVWHNSAWPPRLSFGIMVETAKTRNSWMLQAYKTSITWTWTPKSDAGTHHTWACWNPSCSNRRTLGRQAGIWNWPWASRVPWGSLLRGFGPGRSWKQVFTSKPEPGMGRIALKISKMPSRFFLPLSCLKAKWRLLTCTISLVGGFSAAC